MFGGCTGIVTLLKPENRDFRQKPDDEQLHVLPHYRPDDTDEFGNVEGQQAKIQSGKKNINFTKLCRQWTAVKPNWRAWGETIDWLLLQSASCKSNQWNNSWSVKFAQHCPICVLLRGW